MASNDPQVTPITRRVLRMRDVVKKVGVPASAIEREIRAGRFPKPFKLFADPKSRSVGWFESEVDRYLEERSQAGAQ